MLPKKLDIDVITPIRPELAIKVYVTQTALQSRFVVQFLSVGLGRFYPK